MHDAPRQQKQHEQAPRGVGEADAAEHVESEEAKHAAP